MHTPEETIRESDIEALSCTSNHYKLTWVLYTSDWQFKFMGTWMGLTLAQQHLQHMVINVAQDRAETPPRSCVKPSRTSSHGHQRELERFNCTRPQTRVFLEYLKFLDAIQRDRLYITTATVEIWTEQKKPHHVTLTTRSSDGFLRGSAARLFLGLVFAALSGTWDKFRRWPRLPNDLD